MNLDAVQRQQTTPGVAFSAAAPGHVQNTFDERGRWPGNIYQCPKPPASEKGAGVMHPTVKPVMLMRWLARLVTPPGGTILEPFAGSGTTLVAGHAEGFKIIAVEREPEYCDIITERMRQVAPDMNIERLKGFEDGET
jgi:site-specific DNA-methyltransferase (adenine-specific)